MAGPKKVIRGAFPRLGPADFKVTSEPTYSYNCIAWAAGNETRFWWPDADGYWPPGLPRVASVEAFQLMFEQLGYVRCDDGASSPDIEKVVIYADAAGSPTHAARQLTNGAWTSKLGSNHDIEHKTPFGIGGSKYGEATVFMKRQRKSPGGT